MRLSGLTDGSCAVRVTRVPETGLQIAGILKNMPDLDTSSSGAAPSLLKGHVDLNEEGRSIAAVSVHCLELFSGARRSLNAGLSLNR
jgi:hypothetical protein